MKGVLEFNLDDADDKMAFNRCSKALDMASVIYDFKYNRLRQLRNRLDSIESKDEVLDEVFDTLNNLLYENGIINIDDLIN
jgi:hypothetical protein